MKIYKNESTIYTNPKKKIHLIISLDAKKAFDKIQHFSMLKLLECSATKGQYLNIIKAMYSTPTANMKINGEILEAILLKLGTRQGCLLFPYLFNTVLEVLARKIRQKRILRGYKLTKK
jgi:hypothetical protein